MFSHESHTPVVSVNRSMTRTVWIRAADCSAIPPPEIRRGRLSAPVNSLLLFLVALDSGFAALGPVVVRGEGIRREHEALGRHDQRCVGALRFEHFLEERILLRLLGGDDVP